MEEEVKKEICENLKKYRRKSTITQTELANKLNVSVPAVSQWEKGVAFPEFSKIYDICIILDISIDDLLGQYALGITLGAEDKKTIKKIKKLINKINI